MSEGVVNEFLDDAIQVVEFEFADGLFGADGGAGDVAVSGAFHRLAEVVDVRGEVCFVFMDWVESA